MSGGPKGAGGLWDVGSMDRLDDYSSIGVHQPWAWGGNSEYEK